MLLPHCDEHLVGAVQLLSVLHPHDVGFRHSLNGAAEPDGVPLGHRLIGWMFGKGHSCRREPMKQDTSSTTVDAIAPGTSRLFKGHVLPLLQDDHHYDDSILLDQVHLGSVNIWDQGRTSSTVQASNKPSVTSPAVLSRQ